MIRLPNQNETNLLIDLAKLTGLFTDDEAEQLLGGVLEQYHADSLGEGHEIKVWRDKSIEEPIGWVYYAPSMYAVGVWDLWWIGVHPRYQKSGIGQALLNFVEFDVKDQEGRLLIIETSDTEPLANARKLYIKSGYKHCGTIPNFFKIGDGKMIFAKDL